MSKKEKTKKDIEMAFDFARYLIDHPEMIDKIPNGSEISFNESSKPKKDKPKTRKPLRVDVKHAFEIKNKAA